MRRTIIYLLIHQLLLSQFLPHFAHAEGEGTTNKNHGIYRQSSTHSDGDIDHRAQIDSNAEVMNQNSDGEISIVPTLSAAILCAFCRSAADRTSCVQCPKCNAMTHPECRPTNGKCTSLGCTGTFPHELDLKAGKKSPYVLAAELSRLLEIYAQHYQEVKNETATIEELDSIRTKILLNLSQVLGLAHLPNPEEIVLKTFGGYTARKIKTIDEVAAQHRSHKRANLVMGKFFLATVFATLTLFAIYKMEPSIVPERDTAFIIFLTSIIINLAVGFAYFVSSDLPPSEVHWDRSLNNIFKKNNFELNSGIEEFQNLTISEQQATRALARAESLLKKRFKELPENNPLELVVWIVEALDQPERLCNNLLEKP